MQNLPQAPITLAYRKATDASYTHVLLVFVPIEDVEGATVTGEAYVEALSTTTSWWKFDFDASDSALQKGHHRLYVYGQNSDSNTDTDTATLLFADEVYIENDPANGEVGAYDVETTLPGTTLNAVDQNAADIDALETRVTTLEEEPGGLDCEAVAECAVITSLQTDVQAAQTAADNAQSTANTANNAAQAAQTTADNAQGTADTNTQSITALESEVEVARGTALYRYEKDVLVGGGDVGQNLVKVPINNESHNGLQDYITFDSNNSQWTIEDGKYLVQGSAPCYGASNFRAVLYNVTDGAVVPRVQTSANAFAASSERSFAPIKGEFEVTGGPKVFELQQQADNEVIVFGLGRPSGLSTSERYHELLFTRLPNDLTLNDFTPPDEEPSFVNQYSLDLAVSGEYLEHDALGFTPSTPFTYIIWVKFDDSGQNNRQVIDTGSGGFRLRYNNGSVDFRTSVQIKGNIPITILDNQWHMITITYDGSSNHDGFKLYHDAVDMNLNLNSQALASVEGSNVVIGRWIIASNRILALIDQYAVLDIELSAAEVTAQYNNGAPVDPSAAHGNNVVLYAPMEDQNLTVVTDEVAGNNLEPAHTIAADDYSTDVPE